MAEEPRTLVDHLRWHASRQPDKLYSRYLFDGRDPVELTFGETLERTRRVAAGLAARGVGKGSLVLIILEHHQDLMPAFLGAMWLGAIPAFLQDPHAKIDPERYYRNLEGLIEGSAPKAVLTRASVRDSAEGLLPAGHGGPVFLTMDDVSGEGLAGDPEPHGPEDVAAIQYSSGSTGLQKGAMLSHRAILAEIRGVGEFFEITDDDVFLTWVPLYHDWGLFCVALHSLTIGTSYILLSPLDWVRRPVMIFEAATRYRPTIYYHPNFAFNFMTLRIKDKEMEGLDLSSLRLTSNGAEPCFYESHKMFVDRFEPWGLRRDSLGIVYGMAEVTNTVFAAGHREPIAVDPVDRFILQKERRAQPVVVEDPAAQYMLGVGRALRDTEYRIVDDHRKDLPDREVGEVAIRSRAVMHGYHMNPEATSSSLDAEGWYFTGDMGYRVGSTLFITGRKSDLIIVAGVNIYPQDIEAIVGEHPHAVAGRVAAIGVDDFELGTQKIVLIVESKSNDPKVHQEIAQYARTEVAQRLG
jgi:acyl-CoA synthetase (AMP-forming)/AMP-acid ligase II